MRLAWRERKVGCPPYSPATAATRGLNVSTHLWRETVLFDGDNNSCSDRERGLSNSRSIICAHTWGVNVRKMCLATTSTASLS